MILTNQIFHPRKKDVHGWQFADASWSKNAVKLLFGWTDGLHLTYEEELLEKALYKKLMDEAEQEGVEFTPQVTLVKLSDSRLFAIIGGFAVWLVAVIMVAVIKPRTS